MTLGRGSRGAVLGAAVFVIAAAAPGGAHAEPTFGSKVGLVVKFDQGQPLSDLATLPDLGVRWVRDTVLWQALEPTAGKFVEFPAAFQKRLTFYRDNAIGLVFMLAYGNGVAYPKTPTDLRRPVAAAAFARYAVEVARRLKQSGVRFVLEIWNEPHNFGLRPLLGGNWNGAPPSPWLDHYLAMTRATVSAVKAVDPAIKLLTDDDMWVIHYWFLEGGLPANIDGFAFHPYTNETCPGPEVTAVGSTTEWTKPFVVVDLGRAFNSAVRRLRDRGRLKLGRTPEMWITEWGWKIGDTTSIGKVTPELVAALLPRAYVVAAAAGVEALFWFSAQDSVDGAMGLSNNRSERRPAYFALKTMTQELGAFEIAGQVAGKATPTSGPQAFLFKKGEEYKLAVWTLAPAPQRLLLTGGLSAGVAVDVLGNPVASKRGADGQPYLPVGVSPLYVAGLRGPVEGLSAPVFKNN